MSGAFEARDRLHAYTRRWQHFKNRGGSDESAYFWLAAYLRRMRIIERRLIHALQAPPQWHARIGSA